MPCLWEEPPSVQTAVCRWFLVGWGRAGRLAGFWGPGGFKGEGKWHLSLMLGLHFLLSQQEGPSAGAGQG